MTTTLITDVQQGLIDQIDSTALDVIIWDYLNNPENGFMDQEEVETITQDTTCTIVYTPVFDTTSVIDTTGECIFLDSTTITYIDTTATLTVEEWKTLYLEETNNDAMKTLGKISYNDSRSPNYPLVDWANDLYTFDTTSSVDFAITPDSTAEYFIQYKYPAAEKVDGMYFQNGYNGLQDFDGWVSSIAICYIAYSANGVDWSYIANDAPVTPAHNEINPTLYNTKQEAIDNPFFLDTEPAAMAPQVVKDLMFPDTAIEAQYWRIYFIDALDALTDWGVETGYTGYTASVSHLRFQQIREHGEAVVSKTLERVKTVGTFSTGDVAAQSTTSGSSWFTSAEFTVVSQGIGQLSTHISGRVYADSTAEFRLQVQENGSVSFVTVDAWEFLGEGNVSLHDAREIANPNADLAPWTLKYRLQDRAPVGTPGIEFRLALMTNFRSSEIA